MTLDKAEIFKILGVENRIRIIDLLKNEGPLGVKELSDKLNITPSAVSQHLKILRHAGLVRSERKGYWVPYTVNPEALDRCRKLLSEVCSCGCDGTGRLRDGELENAQDKLSLLKTWEEELEKELHQVRCRIQAMQKGKK